MMEICAMKWCDELLTGCYSWGLQFAVHSECTPTPTLHLLKQDTVVIFTLTAISS